MFSKKEKPTWVYILFLIGASSLIIRYLLDSGFGNSALLYLGIPFAISFFLYHLPRPAEKKDAYSRLFTHLARATIIFLATSAILFEGFICVLFFMPIYYLPILVYYTIEAHFEKRREGRDRSKLRASVLPLFVAFLSLEGLSPSTSFERQNSVTRTMIIEADIVALKSNMALPIDLPKRSSLFLSIFPRPINAKAGSLNPGDVHTLDFEYKRWFFTNTHRGEFHLRLDEVGDDYIKTSVVKNTSYLAKYLKVNGTEVRFTALSDHTTRVELTIHYDRLLDPAWYFGPMQKYAIQESGDYLLSSVIAREFDHE